MMTLKNNKVDVAATEEIPTQAETEGLTTDTAQTTDDEGVFNPPEGDLTIDETIGIRFGFEHDPSFHVMGEVLRVGADDWRDQFALIELTLTPRQATAAGLTIVRATACELQQLRKAGYSLPGMNGSKAKADTPPPVREEGYYEIPRRIIARMNSMLNELERDLEEEDDDDLRGERQRNLILFLGGLGESMKGWADKARTPTPDDDLEGTDDPDSDDPGDDGDERTAAA